MISELPHYALKTRFQTAITGALLRLPAIAAENTLTLIDEIAISGQSSSVSKASCLSVIITGLYHHENLATLSHKFNEIEPLILGIVIAFACRNELNPKTLVSQLCNYLKQDLNSDIDAESAEIDRIIRKLQLAQDLVEQGKSKAIAQDLLGKETLIFGLYCFLSTPQQWQLATQRSGEMHSEISASIGAIAAAYQGRVPAGDRQTIETGKKAGDLLLAIWSGVYNANNTHLINYATITAPDITKRRL